jgi:hypothetical protein
MDFHEMASPAPATAADSAMTRRMAQSEKVVHGEAAVRAAPSGFARLIGTGENGNRADGGRSRPSCVARQSRQTGLGFPSPTAQAGGSRRFRPDRVFAEHRSSRSTIITNGIIKGLIMNSSTIVDATVAVAVFVGVNASEAF